MIAVARGWPRIRFASGTLEALKWLAFAAMCVAHCDDVIYGGKLGLSSTVGRLAFPIFAVVLGYNLARPGIDLGKMAHRLALVAVLATPAYLVTVGDGYVWPLNVLFTFLAVVAVVWVRPIYGPGAALIVGLLAGFFVDAFWPGIALAYAAWRYARAPGAIPVVTGAAALIGLVFLQGVPWSLLALPVLWIATRLDLDVPRMPGVFYVGYVVHLLTLGALLLLVGNAHA